MMRARIPSIRQAAAEAGRDGFEIGGLAYVLPSVDRTERSTAEAILARYYGQLSKPFNEMVHVGNEKAMTDSVQAYRGAGLDVLHLIPVGRSPDLIDRLAGLIGVATQ